MIYSQRHPYQLKDQTMVPFSIFRALVWYQDNYISVLLRIYADRTIGGDYILWNLPFNRLQKYMFERYHISITEKGYLGDETEAIPFDDFKYLVRNKSITLNFKGEVQIRLAEPPYIDVLNDYYYLINVDMNVSNNDFLKAVEDVFRDLNNEPRTNRKCLNMLCEFLQAPKEKKELFRKKLHKAYLNVPKFERSKKNPFYALTIDLKEKGLSETPVEDIIYKRRNRLDDYDDFVKVYDDGYFLIKYREKAKK